MGFLTEGWLPGMSKGKEGLAGTNQEEDPWGGERWATQTPGGRVITLHPFLCMKCAMLGAKG